MKKSSASISAKEANELKSLQLELCKRLRAKWPRLAADHDDIVNEALFDAVRTYRGDNGATRLTHALTILDRKAQRLAKRRDRANIRKSELEATARARAERQASQDAEDPTQVARRETSNGSLYLESGRSKAKHQKTLLSSDALRRLGELHARWKSQLAVYIQGGFIFDRQFEAAHYRMLAWQVQETLGREPPPDFVERLMVFRAEHVRLGGEDWIEGEETASENVPGRGRPSKRGQFSTGRSLESVFREKRRDAASRLAANALRLCGFSTDEIFAVERKASAKESRYIARWAGKLADALAREPEKSDERLLELAIESIPVGQVGEVEGTQDRNPAFRRKSARGPDKRE